MPAMPKTWESASITSSKSYSPCASTKIRPEDLEIVNFPSQRFSEIFICRTSASSNVFLFFPLMPISAYLIRNDWYFMVLCSFFRSAGGRGDAAIGRPHAAQCLVYLLRNGMISFSAPTAASISSSVVITDMLRRIVLVIRSLSMPIAVSVSEGCG